MSDNDIQASLGDWLRRDSFPPELQSDLRKLEALPEGVRNDFWEVLQPNLAPVLDDRVGAAVAKFCRSREVEPPDLLEPVRASRWLVYQAAKHNPEPNVIVSDLEKIAGPNTLATLLPCFQQATPVLRARIVEEALADHGKLVRGVGWRVDTVRRSHNGAGINTAVAMLTFRYTEGGKQEHLTLQMLPETLNQLRYAIEEIVG